MANKRPIPKVDTKQYAESGHIDIKPAVGCISVVLHHCTAFMDEKETLSMLLSTLSAAQKAYGPSFMAKFLTHVDVL